MTNLLVTALPILLLAALFLFLMSFLKRNTKRAQATYQQHQVQYRATLEELILPELRAIRTATEALAAELRRSNDLRK